MSRRCPMWRAPKIVMGARPMSQAMLAKRSSFSDFTPGNGRKQCIAIVKSTGARCRKDAIGGTIRCQSHRGIREARRMLREQGVSHVRVSPNFIARHSLFTVSLDEPEGFACDEIGIPRGRAIEAFKNKRGIV